MRARLPVTQARQLADTRGKLARAAVAFSADTRGAAAVIFAIVFASILLGAAIGLDFARGSAELAREQFALDAAALAASERLGTSDQDVSGPARAQAFFDANTRAGSTAELTSVRLDAAAGSVTATAHGRVSTSMMKAFGRNELEIGASTRVVKGNSTLEVALVLDNSGSMAGTYIADLKTAANSLVNILYTGASGTEKVRVGVIPFAGSVNIGADLRGEAYIDNDGASPVHYENFSANRTRFQLFDDMGVAWKGCVEVRPGAYAVTDASPDPSLPASLFVPMFAPDEPDSENDGGSSFSNSYLVDDGGTCTAQPTYCSRYDRKGACKQWSKVAIETAAAQSRICKYAGQEPTRSPGPNLNCQTRSVLPMTSNQAEVVSSIDAMVASGYTNIGEGLAWGWRVLSPGLPFAEGRNYGVVGNQKIIVLMTDGENTYLNQSNMNKSHYNAYGFASKGRLGANYNEASYRAKMDENLKTTCANARAAGITIFTVAFRLESSPATQALLSACASSSQYAYKAADGTALQLSFEQIGKQLAKLRVAG